MTFRIAKELGMLVSEYEAKVSVSEHLEWIVYYKIEAEYYEDKKKENEAKSRLNSRIRRY